MALVVQMASHLSPKRTSPRSALRFSQGDSPEIRHPDAWQPSFLFPRMSKSDPLSEVIRLRLSAAEKVRLQDDAMMASITMSELIRRRTLGKPVVAKVDDIMIREARRLGGLVKHLHNESVGIYSQETAAALKALRQFMESLVHDRQKGR